MGKTFNYEDLEDWTNKWDKALADGIFEKPEGPPIISKQTHSQDYFNMSHEDHDEHDENAPINECDTKYWSDLYKLTKRYGREATVTDVIKESIAVDKKSYTDALAGSPNPVRPSSVGKDTGNDNPLNTGATYDVADFQKLEDLKLKLHGLIDKLNGFDTKSSSVTKLEGQIESLKKKIDEMSDGFSKSVPSQQGD